MPVMMKNTSVRCIDSNAEVCAKVLRQMMSTLGRDDRDKATRRLGRNSLLLGSNFSLF